MANIAIIIYSMYQHIAQLAESVKEGIEASGNKATIYQVPETLTDDVLESLHAAPKSDYPIATPDVLVEADGVIFGIPTRFGAVPAQLKSFIDSTGGLWAEGKLYGKPAGAFVSTGTNGGRETTIYNLLSTLTHHGMLYVPLGYKAAFGELTTLDEVHGSSPWGAGTVAGTDGSRQPSELELKVAKIQGEEFGAVVAKITFKNSAKPATKTSTKATTTTTDAPSRSTEKKTGSKPAGTAAKETPAKKKNIISRLFNKIFK